MHKSFLLYLVRFTEVIPVTNAAFCSGARISWFIIVFIEAKDFSDGNIVQASPVGVNDETPDLI